VGFVLGGGTVLATSTLNFLALWLGGKEFLLGPAAVAWVGHLPVALIEAFITAAAIDFLYRVKPEMLGMTMQPLGKIAGDGPLPAERQAG
jgi:cobalt/nickel transport system permease protein